MLIKGLGLTLAVKRAGIPIRRGVRGLRAIGRQSLERIAWEGGELAADHLFLHEGVIPNVQVSLALQLRHEWDEEQLCWPPSLDDWGRTSLPDIAVAGDGGGIYGAEAAALSGRIAALDAASQLGHIGETERDRRAAPIRAALDRECALRPFLDLLYRPARSVLVQDEVIACRCEEVSVGQIRRAARLGASGPNQLKAFTRCGMGPCQGRICGPVVSAVIADTLGESVAEIDTYRPRAPFKPITVGALADLETGESEQETAEASSHAAPHPPADAALFPRSWLFGRALSDQSEPRHGSGRSGLSGPGLGSGAGRVRAVVMFTAGFAETGEEGRKMQDRLAEIARNGGVRLCGPNGLGLFNLRTGHPPTFGSYLEEGPDAPDR
jgi:hypothetical protein